MGLRRVLQLRGHGFNLNEKEADTQEVMTSRQPMRPNQLHACFSRALVVCASRQPVKHSVPHGKLVAYKSYI